MPVVVLSKYLQQIVKMINTLNHTNSKYIGILLYLKSTDLQLAVGVLIIPTKSDNPDEQMV